jgi:hypothetical protein
MINQGNNVPDKTLAIFIDYTDNGFNAERVPNIISKPDKTRDWFKPNFYRCLPLAIGNQYGFVIKSEYGFSAIWDGGDHPDSLKVRTHEEDTSMYCPVMWSHFGHGILTIEPPFFFKTPPGVNLMAINPPNYIIPNATLLTGVVETDNIRRKWTFNMKFHFPNVEVHFPAGVPLAAVLPIPRYFGDKFELKLAEELFSPEIVAEELKTAQDSYQQRVEVDPTKKFGVSRDYYVGKDVYGNKFPDHQKP